MKFVYAHQLSAEVFEFCKVVGFAEPIITLYWLKPFVIIKYKTS